MKLDSPKKGFGKAIVGLLDRRSEKKEYERQEGFRELDERKTSKRNESSESRGEASGKKQVAGTVSNSTKKKN
jgi:hypothetical protein